MASRPFGMLKPTDTEKVRKEFREQYSKYWWLAKFTVLGVVVTAVLIGICIAQQENAFTLLDLAMYASIFILIVAFICIWKFKFIKNKDFKKKK